MPKKSALAENARELPFFASGSASSTPLVS
jgi:hypothetical protein